MQTITLIANESPYGSERAFNALRLAGALLERGAAEVEVRLFLLADGVYGGLAGQVRPEGSFCVETMLAGAMTKGALVKACGTCLEHRGLIGLPLVEGVHTATMSDLAEWVLTSDRVVTF